MEPDACEQWIVERLAAAGDDGRNIRELDLPKAGTRKGRACREALERLQRGGRIVNLGSRQRPRYITSEQYRPLEWACEQIEARARDNGIRLASRSTLTRGLKGPIAEQADQALKWLVHEGRLLRLRWAGFAVYLHVSALPEPARPEATDDAPALDTRRLQQAYRQVAAQYSYPDVPIARVHRASGGELSQFKAALLQACREGLAVASIGDWSLASDEERGAAIEINGRPHLRIRFRQGARDD